MFEVSYNFQVSDDEGWMDMIGRDSKGQFQMMPELKLISRAALDDLHYALFGGLDKFAFTARLRSVAAQICRDAQDRGCPVERLLAELKPEWSMILDSCHFPRGTERTEVTNRFIAFCIEEYFDRAAALDDANRGVGFADNATLEGRFDTRGRPGSSPNETSQSHHV